MKGKLVLIGALLIVLAAFTYDVVAFTDLTNQYIADRADNKNECKDDLFEGVIAPDDSENWSIYPDLVPDNQFCRNNSENCNSKEVARKYENRSKIEPDLCLASYYQGISMHLEIDAANPINWIKVEDECADRFEKDVEGHIVNFDSNWGVVKECTIQGQESKIASVFTQEDLEQLISKLNRKWTGPPQIDQNFIAQIGERQGKILDIVYRTLDANQSLGDTALSYQLLLNLYNFGCFHSQARKEQMYVSWNKLNPTGKQCLRTFLSSTQTNAFLFASECIHLGGTQFGSISAQIILDSYVKEGFAERKCQIITLPTYSIGTLQTGSAQGIGGIGQSQLQVCGYLPKKIGLECANDFDEKDKIRDEAFESGISLGLIAIIIVIIFSAIIIYVQYTRGD